RVAGRATDPGRIAGAVPSALPSFIKPSLATLVDRPPEGDEWVHKVKFDGYRMLARIDAGRVRLISRRELDWTLRRRLNELPASPRHFRSLPAGIPARTVHWVEPRLVAEIRYVEWTRDGSLRHPTFLRLREDKVAHEVVRALDGVAKS